MPHFFVIFGHTYLFNGITYYLFTPKIPIHDLHINLTDPSITYNLLYGSIAVAAASRTDNKLKIATLS